MSLARAPVLANDLTNTTTPGTFLFLVQPNRTKDKEMKANNKKTYNRKIFFSVSMREPPLRKTWEDSNITKPLS
jgi:hypothetical protein